MKLETKTIYWSIIVSSILTFLLCDDIFILFFGLLAGGLLLIERK